MNKKLLILGIAVLLLAVGLSGCIGETKAKSIKIGLKKLDILEWVPDETGILTLPGWELEGNYSEIFELSEGENFTISGKTYRAIKIIDNEHITIFVPGGVIIIDPNVEITYNASEITAPSQTPIISAHSDLIFLDVREQPAESVIFSLRVIC